MALQACNFCQEHIHDSTICIYVSLDTAKSRTSCPWCVLLSEIAEIFVDQWSHLPVAALESVRYLIRSSFLSSKRQLCLQWPYIPLERHADASEHFDDNNNYDAIEIEIIFEQRPREVPSWLPWSISSDHVTLSEQSSSPQCIELIQSWLQTCSDKHKECDLESVLTVGRPTRLLQINKRDDLVTLIEAVDDRKYVALSHCWGNLPLYRTTSDNITSHMTSGIRVSCLPRTFQDAIDIAWRLGTEYIWIDSICIKQCDPDEWQSECMKMGSIYGNAHLVIAASLAANGSIGCYGARPKHKIDVRLGEDTVGVFVQQAFNHDVWIKDEPSWQVWDDSHLPLFRRAWAFQERLLARRIVHYTPRELVWECRSRSYCECQVLDKTVSKKGSFPFSLSFKARYAEVVNWGGDVHRLEMWLAIIDQYMARDIKVSSDRLPALSAVARQIDRSGIMGNYIAGMWEPWLHSCLLWYADHRSTRKRGSGTTTHIRRDQDIPTWSWFSVEGLVNTWGRNSINLMKIVFINHQVSINDPYTGSNTASLVLEGRVVPVKLTAELKASVLDRYRIKRDSTPRFGLLIPDTNPLEIAADLLPDTNFVAIEYSVCMPSLLNCLILRQDSKSLNTFRRLGIVELHESFFVGTIVQ